MVGIRSPDGLVVGSCTSHPGVLGSISNERNQGKQEHPVLKYRVPHGSTSHGSGPSGPPLPMTLGISHCGRRLSARHWVWRCRSSPPSPAATNARPPCADVRSTGWTFSATTRPPAPRTLAQPKRTTGPSEMMMMMPFNCSYKSRPSLPDSWTHGPLSAPGDGQRRPTARRRGNQELSPGRCRAPQPGLRLVHHTRQDRKQRPRAAEQFAITYSGP